MTPDALRTRFRALHTGSELFVMPNPWDVASARILEAQGFPALATTSSGLAWAMGRVDGEVDLPTLVAHVGALCDAVDVPISVDAERCFAEDPDGVAATVDALAAAGAAGCSIEDWNPQTASIDPLHVSLERVRAAVDAAAGHGMVITARAENLLRGVDDLDDTVRRLVAFADAGAQCVYAPALVRPDDIGRVVAEVGVAVNVLLLPGVPSPAALASLGVRRVSTGGGLARVAYGALASAGHELGQGESTALWSAPSGADISALIARR